MKKLTKLVAVLLAVSTLALALMACGAPKKPNPAEATMEEMVEYFKAEGLISKDAKAVDISTTEGYLIDNTGGQIPCYKVADEALDYDGIWLFRWDLENKTETYEMYEGMAYNSGLIVIEGGAALLETSATNGAFAIGFAEDFSDKDKVLEIFKGLGE